MSRSFLLVILSLLSLFAFASATSNTDHENDVRTPSSTPATLVVIQDESLLSTHARFFETLTARGHQLTFSLAGADVPALSRYGRFHYDNLVLLAPSSDDLGDNLSLASLQLFVDSGRSVLVLGGVSVGEPIREILGEYNIDVDAEGTKVIDHSSNGGAIASEQHDIVRARASPAAVKITGVVSKPILFRGLGHVAQQSISLTPVLVGSPTAYSGTVGAQLTSAPSSLGRDVLLVTSVQTATNARFTYCGSSDLFSNEFILPTASSSQTGNLAFVTSVASWTFHESGLIRARKLTHYKIGAEHDVNPKGYRVQDNLFFSIIIEEYNVVSHSWSPFVSNDVQLELTMLDPYSRINLTPSPSGVYSTPLTMPDIYGVFKFVINFHRIGYSNLEVAMQVNVHPFRHDEFERFIVVAYPYYAAAFAIMIAFFGFGIVFLYHKE